MKKLLQWGMTLSAVIASALLLPQSSQACTNLIVGKNASVDGSVIVSYAADSHTLYGELYHWAARDWEPGHMMDVYVWDTGEYKGQIPQVAHTYNVVGNMNEHQVCITETTWGGLEQLEGTEGLIDYGSLIYIALQRSKSAREAIDVMTGLVRDHGYCSTGETFTIADKNEVWLMELIGKGKGEKGAVWVATRIPDNAITAHANQARIQKIDFKDKENWLYSKDVISFARQKGLYKGKDADFSFQQVYNPYTFSGLRGCEARVWSYFNRFHKGMDQYTDLVMGYKADAEPMPLYVVPDRKLSVADVQNMMRDHYEGTPMDMTKDAGATYGVPYRWRPMNFTVDGKEYLNERAIATQQTGFVLVAQLRNNKPDLVGPVLWFGCDDANTTVFSPMYGCITESPLAFRVGNGSMTEFSWTSAFWINNWVANMCYNKYDYMIRDIRPVQQELEKGFFDNQAAVEAHALEIEKSEGREAAVAYLTQYSAKCANGATDRYRELAQYLIVKYIDGNVKKEKNGHFATENGMIVFPDQPGYSQSYYKSIAEDNPKQLIVPEGCK